MRKLFLILALFVSACAAPPGPQPTPRPPRVERPAAKLPPAEAIRNFRYVVRRMEPVAERICIENTRNIPCDFRIVVDDRPGLPPNAFQTIDRNGRPVIAFTRALIGDVRNPDELAFVMGHEAAHHILGHIPRQQRSAIKGAVLGGLIGVLVGVDESGLRTAEELGATIAVRSYSKDLELEADRLGTIITARAGFSPVRGAEYFNRIPDPGDRFLGTHPPNAKRIAVVRQTAARLGIH